MTLDKVIDVLKKIIDYTMYENEILSPELESSKKDIISYYEQSKNIEYDIKELLKLKNNKNDYIVERYLNIIISSIELTPSKIESLLYQELPFKTKIILWNKLKDKDKINYLKSKKTLNNEDYDLINKTISNKRNKLYKLIIEDNDLLSSIKSNKLTPSLSILSESILNNKNILIKFKNEIITSLILKYKELYQDFKEYIINNKDTILLLTNQSINLKNIEIDDLNNLLKKYPTLLEKLHISTISKIKEDTLEYLINKNISTEVTLYSKEALMSLNNTYIDKYFNKELITNSPINFLSIYPFNYIPSNITKHIITNYNELKKFNYNVIISLLNNYSTEEDKINLLRNEEFINDIPTTYIESLINNMSFKSIFNMLQNITLLNKINNINIKLTDIDKIFIDGYLDSPSLINKTNNEMIYNMLKYTSNKNYIYMPYINSKLNSYQKIDILISQKINILNDNNKLFKTFNCKEIKYYIDKYLQTYKNTTDILNNNYILNNILNIDSNLLTNNDKQDITYLIDKIYTRGTTTIKCNTLDLDSIKSIIISYLLIGFKNTNKIYEQGNKPITIEKLKQVENEYIEELLPPISHQEIKTSHEKIIDILKEISTITNDINIQKKLIIDNEYLNNFLNITTKIHYETLDKNINTLTEYIEYRNYNIKNADRNLLIFIENIYKTYHLEKKKELHNKFILKIKKHFQVKEEVLYKYIEKDKKEFITYLKELYLLKVLLNKEKNINNFFNKPILEEQTKFKKLFKYNNLSYEEIKNLIIIPLLNNTNIKTILNNLGYEEPLFYSKYIKVKEESKEIKQINKQINKLLNKDNSIKKIYILNNIIYKSSLPFTLKEKQLEEIDNIKNKLTNYIGKVDINKYNNELIYTNILDFNKKTEFDKYNREVNKILSIDKKIKSFVNKELNEIEIKAYYDSIYKKYIISKESEIKVSSSNYRLEERLMTLEDFKKVFKDININDIEVLNQKDCEYLINNIPYIIDNYYDEFTKTYKYFIKNIKNNELKSIYDKLKNNA